VRERSGDQIASGAIPLIALLANSGSVPIFHHSRTPTLHYSVGPTALISKHFKDIQGCSSLPEQPPRLPPCPFPP
jgi:hypothetical protein